MSLNEQLSRLKAKSLAQISEPIQKIMFDDLEKLSASDLIENAPETGKKLKNFTLLNHLGDNRTLAATFVVDVDGNIACAAVDADYTKRAEPADIVKELQSLV